MTDAPDHNAPDWHARDVILESVAGAINGVMTPMEHGRSITLTVQGLIVSGELIPHWQWFDEQAGALGQNHPPDEPGLMAKFGQDLKKHARLKRETWSLGTGFIHLRHAKIWIGGATPVPTNGCYWRGRLSDVNGWFLGHLAEGPDA